MAELTKSGKAIYLRCGVWMDDGGAIHITGQGGDKFHCSVINDPSSRREHPTLFENLAKCLLDAGAPTPTE